jgi:hypothetical protein
LSNIRRETSRHFRNKRTEYVKDKIDELATNSKNKNIRDLYSGITNLRRVTNLEVTLRKIRKVICLQIPTTF